MDGRWITITADHLKALGHGDIIDQARSIAVGTIDPVTEEIAGAVGRVRRAVASGNILDADTTKVPDSLRAVTIRLALFGLCERIGLALSKDQSDTKRNDNSDLIRIDDEKKQVESPDTPAGTGEMQRQSVFETVQEGNCGNSRRDTAGL